MLMFAVSPFCFRVSALVFVPLAHFRTPEYEFRTLSGCAVKMYQICCFVLINLDFLYTCERNQARDLR